MFLIPIVGGIAAGLLAKTDRLAFLLTAVFFVIGSGLLVGVTIADEGADGLTTGTWVAVAIGLLGFPLAWLGRRLRTGGLNKR